MWTFQEPTGSPRVSTGARYAYELVDGNASAPILQAEGGVFGPYSAYFPAAVLLENSNNTQRLYAPRTAVPALTSQLAGPAATVTVVTWLQRSPADAAAAVEGMVVGVWDEYLKARQYAIFTDLGICAGAPVYHGGMAAHISPVGGPTPGQKYCTTAACDPVPLPPSAWHCLANVYNGTHIAAYVNGTLQGNGVWNPFPLTGGIYSPEAAGAPGAEFALGANTVNHTAGSPPVTSNVLRGYVGGLGVWSEPLTAAQVAAVCASARGFESLRARSEGWHFDI